MTAPVLDLAPLAAALFAVPQFLPQLRRALRTGDVEGVSWSWAALTSVGNAAWTVYFASSGYWLALVPSVSAATMAGLLAGAIGRSRRPGRRDLAIAASWLALTAACYALSGRRGLGTVLSAAFVVQVVPAVWTAYRSPVPSGIAIGTWILVLGELSCWGVYGLHRADHRLTVMGATGIAAALSMIARGATAGAARSPGASCGRRSEQVDPDRGPG